MAPIINDNSGIAVAAETGEKRPLLNTDSQELEIKTGPASVSSHVVTEMDTMTEDVSSSDTASKDFAFEDHEIANAFLAEYPDYCLDDIEDIYPCTPLQEGILMSQSQETEDYIIRATMELNEVNGATFDLGRLQNAWDSIISQSSILRTVFVQSTTGEGLFQQVVLRDVPTKIREIQSETLQEISTKEPTWGDNYVAPHCLTFCKTQHGLDGLKLEIHHGVADAIASMKILHELMRLYDDPSQLLKGVPFRSFVDHLQKSSEEKKLEYWQEFLARSQPTMFPKLRVGGTEKLSRRQRRQVLLNREGVLKLVKSKKVSFSLLFHAAWSVLLRAYLRNDDVNFGYISSGRHDIPLPEIQEALGTYISMMVTRARMDDSTRLVDLAAQLRRNISNSLNHEQCSLASIQRRVGFNSGIFNTLVDVQRRANLQRTSEEISLNLIHVHTVAEYDVVLNIQDTGDELLATLDYKTSLLGDDDAENIISCYSTIIDQFLDDPERRIDTLNLFSQAHHGQLAQWNDVEIPVENTCAHDLFEAEAARHPDELAVCSADVNFTYQQLSTLSSRLATRLVSLGAGPSSMIPFCMEKSPWAIVTMMAVMKSGAAFVPMDPTAPPQRLTGILEDTKASIIIASPTTLSLLEQITSTQTLVLINEDLIKILSDEANDDSGKVDDENCVSPEDTAYVLFTSGSTGKPKGVVVPHRALCCSMYAHGAATGIQRTTRALQFASYTFDSVIAEVFTVLIHGGCVCVPSDEDRMNNAVGFIKQFDVNWVMLTPTFVRTLDPATIPGVDTLVLIGEAVDQGCLDTWLGKVRLFNGYGPTETTVICVARQFPESSEIDPANIGNPVGCRAWVVDPVNHNLLSPIGAVGELIIEGPNITKGYLGDPEKTEKSFITTPLWSSRFNTSSPTTFSFYKTGDLVRNLSDGTLKFCGRVDSQVKVNGQRLELGEVETHLLSDSSTVQALAEVPKSGPFEGRLVAVLRLNETSEIQKHESPDVLQLIAKEYWNTAAEKCDQLSDKLHASLPAYMVPTVWIPIQKMSLSSSGKLDRQKIKGWLSYIDGEALKSINEFQTSATEESGEDDSLFRDNQTAYHIRKIWSEVLNIPEHTIGASNAFLSIGGESISAMRIVSKARTQGYPISVQEILQYRTISALVSHLQEKESSSLSTQPRKMPIESRFAPISVNQPNGPDFGYWDMVGQLNRFRDDVSAGFELDSETTAILFKKSQETLRAEPSEALMGIILFAFQDTFKGRQPPTIFSQEHSMLKHATDDKSLTLLPVSIDSNEFANVSQVIRQVRDVRQTLLRADHPVSGECRTHEMKEVIFEYRGNSPEEENPESIQLSLFEISAIISNDRLSLDFKWSPRMKHQDEIRTWVDACASAIRQCANKALLKPLASLSDYPLMECDYKTLDGCTQKIFQDRKLQSFDQIEDIYPCAPCQEGMIVSQVRYPDRNLYCHETTWQVSSTSGDVIDIGRLEAACRVIIQRHQILRTVFCETGGQQVPFVQVVFKDAATLKVQVSRSNVPASDLTISAPKVIGSSRFPYQFVICDSPDGVSCKFLINHVLLDGSCLRVLIQELTLIYDQISLPSPPLYSTFIDYLSSHSADESYAYWKSLLKDVGSCHFPSLNSSVESGITASRLDVLIPDHQVTALRQFCKEHAVTLAAVMNAVWALVLRTYIGSDTETICFGYMASGRDVPVSGVHEMMGPLLNMLVQTVDMQSSTTISTLVQNVYDRLVRNLPHQNCSLSKIQSSLNLGAQSLFNTLVNVQKVNSASGSDGSNSIGWKLMAEGGPAEYDVIFGVVDSDEGIKGDLLFWTSCISETQAVDLGQTVLQVLTSLLEASSETTIATVQVLPEPHAQQLREWNSRNPHFVDSCLHHIFEEHVALYPEAPAISTTWAEGNWTYAHLDTLSTRLAAHLQSYGVKTGMAVPFCLDRSPWTMAIMLAILKSGGACVALDPSYPIQRLKQIIGMTDAKIIVCEERYTEFFDNMPELQLVSVTPQLWECIPDVAEYKLSAAPSDPAFVNFTSGSTGVPKGNILQHNSLASALWHHRALDPVDRHTRGLHFASYTFDMSFAEILLVLLSGGCLCIPTEYERLNQLSDTIKKLDVNWSYLTPTVASLLSPSEVPGLKTICLGGEPVLDALVDKWLHKAKLIATYGPSECSIAISRSEVQGYGNGQLGPASGGLLWIVDPTNHDILVPIGAPGELIIEGPLVGRDYLDPDMAKASFIVDPTWTKNFPVVGVPESGRRMYKTGDIVRFNKDGSMVMLGRKAEDGQAKIHGQRVDLGEVSHHITASGIVQHAICLVAKKGPFAGNMIAILSTMDLNDAILGSTDQPMTLQHDSEARQNIMGLRQWLENRVPSYMIPRSWILLEKVPVTLNAKLNRRALLNWLESVNNETYQTILLLNNDDDSHDPSTSIPLNPMEKRLAKAWGEVLGVPKDNVTANQSFFSLGGDSIAAIRVSSYLLNEGIQISMHDILQYRTLSEISKRAKTISLSSSELDSKHERSNKPFALVSKRLSEPQFEDLMNKVAQKVHGLGAEMDIVEDIFPCSPMQEGILFSRARQNDLYELVNDFKVAPSSGSGPVSVERFRRAIEQVVSRHQSLRSFFMEGDDSIPYVQVVQKAVQSPIACIESTNSQNPFESMDANKTALRELGYRFTICQIAGTEDVYGRFEVNHALIDGASMKNLITDIRLAYDNLMPISQIPPRYRDFVDYLEHLPSEKSLDYWKSVVQGLESCILPSLNTSTSEPNMCKAIDEVLRAPTTEAIFEFCKNYDTTVATVISVAWALVLRAYVGMDTVCFGYLTSGRAIPVPQAESIIGPLITMMVSRVDLSEEMAVVDMIRSVHDGFLSGLEHQHTSLSAIQQAFDGGNKRGQMFNTVVNVLKGDLAVADELPSSIELQVVDAQGPTEYDVSLDVVHTDEKISLSFSYWTACISDEQAALMQKTLLHALEQVLQGVSGKVGELSLFSEAHRSSIMQWASSMPPTTQACMHELVEQAVQSQPNKDAIVTSDLKITYQELDTLASSLAAHLAFLGVGPEVMVPFCFDKSPWTIVAMYAILKAGGSCAALSPEFPDSRLSNMIEATQATLVICDSKHAARVKTLVSRILPIDTSISSVGSMLSSFEALPKKTPSKAMPHHPAVIAFTSGSTGTPKGIILEHASMCTSIFAHGPLVQLSETSRVLQFSSYTFDASLEEIFTTLVFRGTIFVPTEYERMNELSSFIKTHQVNFASLTPTVASLLNPEDLPLKTVDIAGEMVPQNLASKWATHTNLVVTYGPAECSIISSGMLIDPNHVQNGALGKPAGTLMWIVDASDHNKLVPIGCAGEILIEGPLLARGYIQSEQTEKAFIFDPDWTKTLSVPGTGTGQKRRMYKTGDLARYEPDGSIIYLGRMDSQVKIYGQRVDLGEVETTLDRYGVGQAVAMVPKNGHFVKKLVVVFSLDKAPSTAGQSIELVTNNDVAGWIAQLRKDLQGNIPAYMLPRVWVPVQSLPVNPNGKLDRRAIQRWLESQDEEACERIFALGNNLTSTQQLSKIEKLFVSVWSQVLGIPESTVDVDQPFFSLGGDSISAIRVTSLLRSEGIHLAVHDIFRHRTISALADIVRSDHPEIEGIENKTDSFPLTPVQAMHFKVHPHDINHLSQTYILRPRRRVSFIEMNDAFMTMLNRHPMLNARFRCNEHGDWSQMSLQNSPETPILTHEKFMSTEEAMASFKEMQTCLDIENGPLVTAKLVDINETTAEAEQLLCVVLHQLIADVPSCKIMLDDLEAIFLHETLSPISSSFKDWVFAHSDASQRKASTDKSVIQHPSHNDVMKYWDMGLNLGSSNREIVSEFSVDTNVTSLIVKEANNALRTEASEILLAVLHKSFLATFPDRPSPRMFFSGSGRNIKLDGVDASQTVGCFTTMTPVCQEDNSDLASANGKHESQMIQTLRSIKDQCRLPHMGLTEVEEIEVLLTYVEGASLQGRFFENVEAINQSHLKPTRQALFDVQVQLINGQLAFRFVYSADMAHQNTIQSWIQTFEKLLSSAAKDLAQASSVPTLSDLPLLTFENYTTLDNVVENCKSWAQVSDFALIESIHPCSPMQEGILLSTSRVSDIYDAQEFWKVLPKSSDETVDPHRLLMACKGVIARHDILRTHLVEAHHADSAFLQVVLKDVHAPVCVANFNDLNDLMNQPLPQLHETGKLPYLFTVCILATGEVYLRLDISHALSDGVSTGILIRDLLLAYDDELSPVGPCYENYISHLESQKVKNQSLKFWKEALAGATPCHFPLLNESEVGSTPVHRSTSVDISLEQKVQVREFCKVHDTTLANFMSAIWALVLPCFSDASSDTATFGYLTSGRDIPLEGVHDILGPMITILIRNVNFDPKTTVLQLLNSMQQDFVKTWPHQHCSLSEIHHALELSGTPLFNTIVNLGNAGGSKESLEDMPGRILFVPENVTSRSEYDIAFNILDSDKGFWLDLSYWDRCLSEAQATVLSHTIQAAIKSVLENPNQAVSDVTLVDNFHMDMFRNWNAEIPEPVLDCIHHTFERQVELQPEAPAVCSNDPKVSLTYQQLNDMANALAQALRNLGVGPESLVPFCMDKSPWTPVAMIAILKAGGACVALDPNQPIMRLKGIIDASQASVVLAAPQHKDMFSDIVPHVVVVGQDSLHELHDTTTAVQPTSATSSANHNNPAFVIFTSGSTGTPKGIVVEHGAYCSSARSHAPILGLQRGSRVLQFASYTYDLSIAETFTTLMVGGCICVPSEYDRLNRLAAAINAMEADWMFLTPTVAALLQPEQVPLVRTLVLGGEHATHNNFSTWGGRPGICLINSYGPAECSIWTNANVGVKTTSDISNLGRRLGCSLWVADPRNHNRLFPMYARGELVIGGPTLARGYLHDPAKTEAAFIQPPTWFCNDNAGSQRLYKSGDLVHYNLDGSLSIQGRKDNQVKVHGHRIELDDINSNMASISLIEHAMAQLPRTGPLNGRLVAVASLQDDRAVSNTSNQVLKIMNLKEMQNAVTKLRQIRAELEKQLPKHMLPTIWILVEKMPLLSSGKLDKRAVKAWLDAMDEETYNQTKSTLVSETESALELPENELEQVLQKVWSEVLKCEPASIGMTASFLSLGGDSISAMQAVSRARNAGINIFVQDIFKLKNIRKLAEHASLAGVVDLPTATPGRFGLLPTKGAQQLDQLVNQCISSLHLDATDVGIEDIFPCSPMQEGILISQARSPDRYHVRALFEVLVQSTELVDVDRLEQAWIKVAQRHQALRSVFLEGAHDEANVLQVVLDRVTVPVLKLECDKIEDFTDSVEVNEYAKNGPPYRFSICKLPTGVVYCHLAMTHALDDGSSMRVLLRDVCLAYDGMLSTGDPPLYSNFISYIRRQPKATGLNFWKSYLSDAVPSHFPALTPNKSSEQTEDGIVERWIQGDQASAILRLCEEHDITVADVFKTSWAIVLGAFLGAESVCFGYLASGRDAPVADVHNIMGPLINMLVFHANIEKSKSLIELCKEANESYLNALPHQHCSLKEIFHAARGTGEATSLFNTVVNVQKGVTKFFVDEQDSTAHRTIDLRSRVFHDPTEYELSIDVQNFESSMVILMNYWTSLLSVEQANRLTDLVLAVVEGLLDDPQQTVGQLQLCAENDMALLSKWNQVPLVEEDRCLHEVIAEQASSKPDATAVVSDEGSLTFNQLNEMANKLAHHLMEIGAGPEVIIPCCFEKSLWAIVAMLGVLKAGAACAALEPAHPLERLQTIVKDTQAPFILCSSAQASLVAQIGLQAVLVTEGSLNKLPAVVTAPSTSVEPSNKAFIVYTSGSTGTPKGAILEHRNLYASSRGFGTFGMNGDSRVAHFSSYAFDVSIGETMLALTHGACVCIISEEDRLGDLTAALNRFEATFTQLTPTVVRTLEPSQLPYLRTVVTAGELLTDDIINKWSDKVQLFNSYGPCECAINSTGSEQLMAGARGAVIGKPLQSRLYIINPENDQLLVPVGAVGELVVSGPIVGRGYLNNPDKTRAAFIDTPSWVNNTGEGARFYRTGDLARWTPDGSIHYMGRKDVQVKIRGQRIELGEVECQITEKAGSSFKAVVAAVPSGGILKQRLIALLSVGDQARKQSGGLSIIEDPEIRSSALEEIAGIRESVKKSLPRHMVPGLWIPVHNVPKLPSGKTNRRLINQWLEQMDQELHAQLTTSSQPKIIEPSSDMESMLQRIWGDLLHLDAASISMDQSFLLLGGDSVLAMQLMARCRAEGFTVKIRDIFQFTTIAALAPRCIRTESMETKPLVKEAGVPQNPLTTAHEADLDLGSDISHIDSIYPASPMQNSILNIQKTQQNAWYASFIVEATSSPQSRSPEMEDLAKSWQQVVNRHAILRTVFKAGKSTGRYYQIVLKSFAASIACIDDAPSNAVAIFNKSPDMPEGETPPHRVILAKTKESGRIFMQLQISHALYDAVGISVIWHDLQVAYSSIQTGGVAFDGIPASPYKDFISYIDGLSKTEASDYWKERLGGTSSCFFPSLPDTKACQSIASMNSPSTSPPMLNGSFNSLAIPLNRTSKIRAFCKEHAVTTANLFQTAWALVLRHFTRSDDVSFGFMLSGRDAPLPHIDSILGPLINLLPCTVKSRSHGSLESMLRELQSNYAETLMHQNCSLEEIHESLGAEFPLYNTFLNMQRVTRQAPYSQSRVQFNEVDAFMTDEYAISVYVSDAGDDIFMEMCYWTSILSDESAKMVGKAILRALDVLFEASPADFPLSLML